MRILKPEKRKRNDEELAADAAPVHAGLTNINGVELALPIFNGYWVDPDSFYGFPFAQISIEMQSYPEKPLTYRKFRFDVLMKNLAFVDN